jgi:hypothetical protein
MTGDGELRRQRRWMNLDSVAYRNAHIGNSFQQVEGTERFEGTNPSETL